MFGWTGLGEPEASEPELEPAVDVLRECVVNAGRRPCWSASTADSVGRVEADMESTGDDRNEDDGAPVPGSRVELEDGSKVPSASGEHSSSSSASAVTVDDAAADD